MIFWKLKVSAVKKKKESLRLCEQMGNWVNGSDSHPRKIFSCGIRRLRVMSSYARMNYTECAFCVETRADGMGRKTGEKNMSYFRCEKSVELILFLESV